MLGQNKLLENLAQRHYTFKRAELPESFELGAENGDQMPPVSPLRSKGPTTWHDVAKKYCKEVLALYPYESHRDYYDEQVCLIQTELKFKNSTDPGAKWTLLKSNDEINKFTKKWQGSQQAKNKQKIPEIQNPTTNKPNDIFNILGTMSATHTSSKDYQIFTEFLEQMIPEDKWNLKVLGQYQVRVVEVGGVKNCLKNTLCFPCLPSVNYYVTITTQNMLLSEQSLLDGEVEGALPFTYALTVVYEVPEVSNYQHKYITKIVSGRNKVIIAFQNLFDLLKFSFTFNQVRWKTPYFSKIRFNSFSPPRENNWAKFYNDSQQYFSDLHDEIQQAKFKICITGWCITPYLLLKRPQNIETGSSRLDKTLERAARRGVKIFIIVFQEPSLFVNNDSFNVWNMFQNMHENFKVLRHPGLIIPQLWSHHQKSIMIDQKVGFMGGLDICYGRWDTHDHPIYDKDQLWQGADFNNERQRSITQPRKYWQSNLNRKEQPRMPWHDIAIQVKGAVVIDMQRHFVQYWYFAIRDLSDDPHDYLRNFRNRYNELMRMQKQKRSVTTEADHHETERNKLFSNRRPNETEMEMIQHVYAQIKTKEPQETDYTMRDRFYSAKQALKDVVQHKASRTAKEILVEGFMTNANCGNMKLQLCRSSSRWSTGIKTVQHSIYNAYIDLISKAKEFIYIENQFFMSHENEISEKIAERIRDAFRNKQNFKVIVMMPLLPGFEGDPRDQNAGVLRVQMHIQYEAINRHKTSIFQLLIDLPIDMNEYIYFVGVRNHGLFGENKDIPKTQIIYVHSKLMIVDDRYMIIGSANINDRSLLGSRDSQLAMVIEDSEGQVGKGSIFEFRCRIFKQHFNMYPQDCVNLSAYWKKFIDFSKSNTQIYRKVFGCYPDNMMVKFEDVARLQKEAKPELYWKEIINLQGHYVEWPINFLKNEDLSLQFGQKEFLAPITFFT